MEEILNLKPLNLINDIYDGITLDSSTIPMDINIFEREIIKILDTVKNKKLFWIKISTDKSHLIPFLTKHDFIFHHCNEKDITMLKRLANKSVIPTPINHTIGVGAVVIDNNKILVVKDRIHKNTSSPEGSSMIKKISQGHYNERYLKRQGLK